ncbi:uncharacterized protein KQ657_001411 [Scheffersomyces spartinae]|uniref:Xylanolytic transcriptional activator regulatory domain-containing protein n=1 Tax=Scheffersomyces spartinae TaxID=45513 RepID=A0A9P7V7G3_9ASCO|nr:uncharacterized protein KQ657_001411 [Scheffersomyces spartinae]KAG7192631.1 hypothetical protein KQ657_001411 [Scheffersomyces spartinae]
MFLSHKYLISHISPPVPVTKGSEQGMLMPTGSNNQVPPQFVDATPFIPRNSNQNQHPKTQNILALPVLPVLNSPHTSDVQSLRGVGLSQSSTSSHHHSTATCSSNDLSPPDFQSRLGTSGIIKGNQPLGNIFIGPYPLESAHEEMSFHSSPRKDYKEVLPPPRTLHFKALLRFDPGIQFFWKYRPLLKPEAMIRKKMIYISEEKVEHYTLEAKRIYGDGYIPRPEEANEISKIKLAITKFAGRMGLNFAPNIDYSVNLVSRLKLMLSGIEVTPYVNKFFKNVYLYFPVIEQEDFTKDLSRILGQDLTPTTTCQNLKFEERDDVATIAILLIMIRWVSISEIELKYDTQSYLLVPTDESSRFGILPIEFVDLAEDCMKELNITRFRSIRILQSLLFIRAYRMHAPEEVDSTSGSSTQVFNGIIINMAFALGLNRDPSKVANYDPDPKVRYQQKKLWFYVNKLDLIDSMLYGSMLSTSDETFDLSEITVHELNASVQTFQSERIALDLDLEFNQISGPLKKIVKVIVDLKNPVRVSSLLEEATKLEICMKHILGEFSKYLDPNYFIQKLVKVWKFVIYLHCQMVLCYIYHILFLHYEQKRNYQIMLFYFNKYINIVVVEWAQLTPEILAKAFDGNGWLLIAPTLQLLYQMLLLICNTSILRLSAGLYRIKIENIQDPAKEEAIRQFLKVMEDTCMHKIRGLYSLRNRYSMAWKLSKVHFGVYNILKDLNYFDSLAPDIPDVGYLPEIEFGLATSDIQNTVSRLSMLKNGPFLTVENLVSSLKDRADKCLAESIQIDNMWIHMANFYHDADAVPLTCQNDGSSGLGLESTSYSIFPTDFEPFGSMLLFQI